MKLKHTIASAIAALISTSAAAIDDDTWLIHRKLQPHHLAANYFAMAIKMDGSSLWLSRVPCAAKSNATHWMHGISVTPSNQIVEICWQPNKTKSGIGYATWCHVRGNYKAVTNWCFDADEEWFVDGTGYLPKIPGNDGVQF